MTDDTITSEPAFDVGFSMDDPVEVWHVHGRYTINGRRVRYSNWFAIEAVANKCANQLRELLASPPSPPNIGPQRSPKSVRAVHAEATQAAATFDEEAYQDACDRYPMTHPPDRKQFLVPAAPPEPAECVCGGSTARPNRDCERCQLVATIAKLEETLAEYAERENWTKPVDDHPYDDLWLDGHGYTLAAEVLGEAHRIATAEAERSRVAES